MKMIIALFLIFISCNNQEENSLPNSEIELAALRTNDNFAKGYRVLKTTIKDDKFFESIFPKTNISVGQVLRYYFYTAIDLSSEKNQLISMDNTTFELPITNSPVDLTRAVIHEIRKMSIGSSEYKDFIDKYFSGCIEFDKISDDCVIPELYQPVCGCDGVTYSNKSAAGCKGVLNYEDGICN